jgi:hypothetical protein
VSIYNYLQAEVRCPWCGVSSTVDAEFRFGLRELHTYHIGDALRWEGKGVRTPAHRPDGGNYVGAAYAECPSCGRDYWLRVHVEDDLISTIEIDAERPGYIQAPKK